MRLSSPLLPPPSVAHKLKTAEAFEEALSTLRPFMEGMVRDCEEWKQVGGRGGGRREGRVQEGGCREGGGRRGGSDREG